MERVKINSGNSEAEVFPFGATVSSWKCGGIERLFLSSKAKLGGTKAIRGGIPLVFPNFGPWDLGPQHGFARIAHWSIEQRGDEFVIFALRESPETYAMWPHKFTLNYTVRVAENALYTILTVENTDDSEFDFTALLHTYLKVHLPSLKISGFFGASCSDSLTSTKFDETRQVVEIDRNVDQIYSSVMKSQTVASNHGTVEVKREGLPDVVLWNPWAEKAKAMSDFDDEGFRQMVCVEPGHVANRKTLKPGEKWTGSQWLLAK